MMVAFQMLVIWYGMSIAISQLLSRSCRYCARRHWR
jgi:hypothetical protein